MIMKVALVVRKTIKTETILIRKTVEYPSILNFGSAYGILTYWVTKFSKSKYDLIKSNSANPKIVK